MEKHQRSNHRSHFRATDLSRVRIGPFYCIDHNWMLTTTTIWPYTSDDKPLGQWQQQKFHKAAAWLSQSVRSENKDVRTTHIEGVWKQCKPTLNTKIPKPWRGNWGSGTFIPGGDGRQRKGESGVVKWTLEQKGNETSEHNEKMEKWYGGMLVCDRSLSQN